MHESEKKCTITAIQQLTFRFCMNLLALGLLQPSVGARIQVGRFYCSPDSRLRTHQHRPRHFNEIVFRGKASVIAGWLSS